MASGSTLNFELSTGIIYADQGLVESVEAGQGPRNLVQLLAAGRLLVGNNTQLELNPEAEQTDLVPLSQLLQPTRFFHKLTRNYERINTKIWNRTDQLNYGRWLDLITREPDRAESRLIQHVLVRGSRLGIGPSDRQIARTDSFPSVNDYFMALGIIRNRKETSLWSAQNLANYTEYVFLDLLEESKEKSADEQDSDLESEIERRAKLGHGPSLAMYQDSGGPPMKFLAMNGYIDTRSMGADDYVEWGVKFMLTNKGKLPTSAAVDLLSRTRKAPGMSDFLDMFQSWPDYVSELQTTYDRRGDLNVIERLPEIIGELKEAKLPADIFDGHSAPDFIPIRARWLLLNTLFPAVENARKLRLAQRMKTSQLEKALLKTGRVDKHDIRVAAKSLNISEDLWPYEPGTYDYLKVPEELLEEKVKTAE